MRLSSTSVSGPVLGLLILVSILPSAGCDSVEPPMFPVGDTVVLYSLARAEYIGYASAFDFRTPQAVVVEQPKGSDFAAFDVAFSELDGDFVLLPAGLFESFGTAPGIAVDESGVSFEELSRAPSEGYVTDAAVPLGEGPVYVIRTRSSGACSQYAKMEVLELAADGVLEFRFLRNNLCNDRTLEPDES
jgi:hypothetical protein